jgi:hypothetical protein
LLERARLKPNAKHAILYAAEGYTTGHTIERLMRPANFLAYDMDGEPLTRIHGFPLRVLMPGIYGMKLPKWLTRIELVDKNHLGYWEWMGWSDAGERQLQSVIDDPHDAQQIAGQSFVVTGWAVEMPLESQKWKSRPTAERPGMRARFSAIRSVAGVGVLALCVGQSAEREARDSGAGDRREWEVADVVPSNEWPDGATGYHTVTVNVT